MSGPQVEAILGGFRSAAVSPLNDEPDRTIDQTITFAPTPEPKIEFRPPPRIDFGTKGRQIALKSNFFQLKVPSIQVHHYEVVITPSVPRKINRSIIGKLQSTFPSFFENVRLVYDGKSHVYTKLPIFTGSDSVNYEVRLDDDTRCFTITLLDAGLIDTTMLEHDIENNVHYLSPDVQHAIDVILRHCSSLKYTTIGRCFFAPPGPIALAAPTMGCSNLGHGREIWFGYHQSLQNTQMNMMVNLDSTTTAFYKGIPVVQFLAEVLQLPIQALSERKSLSDVQRLRFGREIKSLKVEVTHSGEIRRKYRVSGITKMSALSQTFKLNTTEGYLVETTVANYFRDKYGLELVYPHLPCLHVGNPLKSTFLPIEVCRVVDGQRCLKRLNELQTSQMIAASQRNAPERAQEILRLLEKAEICKDPNVEQYGISISPKMMELTGRVLNSPKLLYSAKRSGYQTVSPNDGSWDMRDKEVHQGVVVDTWAMICFTDMTTITQQHLRRYISELQKVSKVTGMPILTMPCFCKYAMRAEDVEPMFRFIKKKFERIQMILVVLPGKTSIYAEVKKVGDTLLGIPTQCIAARNLIKASNQTLTNLCLKMNVKMGGVNNVLLQSIRPQIFTDPVIFIGADVTHPQTSDSTNKPTICALVASMDAHPSRYAASVRLQTARAELIVDMAEMVRELLIKFRRSTGFRPMRIVMYRAGVSDGQFYNCLQHELRAIREACMSLESDYQPGVTYLIVQKRHHARLFATDPRDYTGKSCNIPAGTTVDTCITHPSQNDFFLCSHAGIQGTSRPTRYHVLWDDNKLSADDLQDLTYQLCHTYVRCTRSVSIPAPVYYAHLVAFRARYHLADNQPDSSVVDSLYSTASSEITATKQQMADAVKVHPETDAVMYYA